MEANGFDERRANEYLRQQMVEYVRRVVDGAKPKLLEAARRATERAISESDTWVSLQDANGKLRIHLGLEQPAAALEAILNVIIGNIRVNYIPAGGGHLGGVRIEILQSDFEDIISNPASQYVSIGLKQSILIPWLRWLLFEGGNRVIAESEIKTDRSHYSGTRTQKAVMVTPKHRASLGWAVPEEFQGTPDDNFLTRALDTVGESLADEFLDILRSA